MSHIAIGISSRGRDRFARPTEAAERTVKKEGGDLSRKPKAVPIWGVVEPVCVKAKKSRTFLSPWFEDLLETRAHSKTAPKRAGVVPFVWLKEETRPPVPLFPLLKGFPF